MVPVHGFEAADPSTPLRNPPATEDLHALSPPPRGKGIFGTPQTEKVPLVSQERSASTHIPLMPTMDFDVTDIDAPSTFFLATPAQLLSSEKRADPGRTQSDQVSRSQTKELETRPMRSMEGSISRNLHGASPSFCRWWDADEGIDEEVAFASNRAYGQSQQVSATTRFKLRPKPLREEDLRDPDLLFRL